MTPEMKDNIPEGWHTYTLGEIYTERKEAGEPELPILTVSIHSGVSDGALDEEEIGKTVKRIADKTQYKTARTGDLVFNMMRAWQGAIGVARSNGLVSPAYIVATPNEELVYPLFMDYYMKSPKMVGIINRQSYGVTDFRKRLYWDSFTPIKCTLPSIAEQKKIAQILDLQNRNITQLTCLLTEKLRQEEFLAQQFLSGKLKMPGHKGSWKRIRLNEVLAERKEKNSQQDLTICSVAVEKGVVDQVKHLGRSFAASDTSNYGVSYYGDIVYTKSPTGDFPFGIIKQNQINGRVAISPLYGIYEPVSYDIGFILNVYFQYPINVRNYLLPIVQKGAKNTINITNDVFISNYLYLPLDPEEQKDLASFFKTAEREIDLLKHTISEEKRKKTALMQLLLTGIVRV